MRWLATLFVLSLTAAAPSGYAAMQAADARLGAIAWRLEAGNAVLCRNLAPATGMTLLSLGQFPQGGRAVAQAAFGFAAPLGVEAVAAGSPADHAGVRVGDAIVAIDGQPLDAALPPRASVAGRAAGLDALANGAADRAVTLTVRRNGADRAAHLEPLPGCRIIIEISGSGKNAQADNRTVQVGGEIITRYDDALLAAILAHEMSHVILRHHDRLNAAQIKRSTLSAFGRSGQVIRQTEDDADRLSVSLLYNAGFDPRAAVSLWRDHGGEFEAPVVRVPNHSSPKDRAAKIAAEIATIPAGAARPWMPSVLATRDQPIERGQ